MRRHFAALLLAGFLAAPAAAQPPLDPAALELARVLMQRDQSLYDDADTARLQARIENLLLAEPGACNAFVISAQRSAPTVGSPVRVRIGTPCADRKSPRSTSFSRSYGRNSTNWLRARTDTWQPVAIASGVSAIMS